MSQANGFYGYTGKILDINLSTGSIKTHPLDRQLAATFIGGRGLAGKILYDALRRGGVDPFSVENVLIFATGPLTGTPVPTSGRHCIVTKSPLTNTFLDTHAGGFFGREMKLAGYDLIIVRGKAREPVYISVIDGKAEIRPASHLWGLLVSETTKAIKEELGDPEVKVSCIGPAGEKLVRLACIQNDIHRSAGRGGAGAVMGSKNLKAVAVRGSKEIAIFDQKRLMELNRVALEAIMKNPITGVEGTLRKYGSAGIVNIINEHGIFPTRNFQDSMFEYADKISGEEITRTILKGTRTCYACPIRCTRYVEIDSGPYAGVSIEDPEYETCWSLGANCGVSRLDVIVKANELCNEFGIDTISVGSVIAFAMELYERGILTQKDTQGIKLNFGNAEALIALVEQIAKKEGLGAILGEGVKRASQIIGRGAEKYAMHVKGMELPGYDPRGAKGMGLAYATSSRGACHLRAYTLRWEIFGAPYLVDPLTTENKAALVVQAQHEYAVVDALILCVRAFYPLGMDMLAKFLSAVTGKEYTTESLYLVGERIYNLERLFNVREGFTRKDDTLPERLVREPVKKGPAKGHTVNLKPMLDEYYRLRGWDENGIPTKEKLKELGLEP